MQTSLYVKAFSIGLVFHFTPKVLSTVFPNERDQHIASFARNVIKITFDETIENLGEKANRICKVVIPDNLGIATGIISLMILDRKDSIHWQEISPILSFALLIMAASHIFRETSYTIFAPVSKDYLPEKIGKHLENVFKSIGPSDFRQRFISFD